MNKLRNLFKTVNIGSMEVRNRLVMAPIDPGPVDENGCVTPQLAEFFAERARGGVGMIVVGGTEVIEDAGGPGSMGLWDDYFLPTWEKMVSTVHPYDVKLGIQLINSGAQADGMPHTFGPSSVAPLAGINVVPREMTKDEIRKYVDAFSSAAGRAVQAGFDFVEISACHGYLISEFLTPYYNRRSDEYGGSFENRTRFLLEIVDDMKGRLGDGVPIGVRINGDDFIKEGGWTLWDSCKLAPILEKAGANYLSISGGIYGADRLMIMPMYEKQVVFVHLSAEIKKHVSIPVITVKVLTPIKNHWIGGGETKIIKLSR